MRKKEKNASSRDFGSSLGERMKASSKGFDSLLNVHVNALEENSKIIMEMLTTLKGKELSKADMKEIKFIKRELKRLDEDLENLGD